MKEAYNLRKHGRYGIIQLQTGGISYRTGTNTTRVLVYSSLLRFVKDWVIYDTKKKEILCWREPGTSEDEIKQQCDQIRQNKNDDYVEIDNFIYKLYAAFKKDKSNLNEEDNVVEHVLSDYIRLIVSFVKEYESLDEMHYMCVVPREWDYNIREQVLRPVFIQAGLISETDHNDRLLFLSDMESTFYFAQGPRADFSPGYYKAGDYYVLSRRRVLKNGVSVSIKIDLIEAQHSLFNVPGEHLYPRVIFSSTCFMSEKSVKTILNNFLKLKLFPTDYTNVHQSNLIIQDITEYIYWSMKSRKIYGRSALISSLKTPWIIVKEKWMLNEAQSNYLKSFVTFDICLEIGKIALNLGADFYLYSKTRQRKPLLVSEGYYRGSYILPYWSLAVIEAVSLSLIYTSSNIEENLEYRGTNALLGATYYIEAVLHSSDIKSKPCILSSKEPSSSSFTFPNDGADAIVSIDISLKFTIISYSLVKGDGNIEMILDNNYFTSKKCLPPLKSFFKFSDVTTLMVNEKYISLIDNYLLDDDLNCLFVPEYYSQKTKNLLVEFEDIIENIHSNKDTLVSTQQPRYIEAFLLMYFIYLNELVVNGISYQQQRVQDKKTNTGFLFSVEKRLLDCIIGTKENLRKIIYKSGLVEAGNKYSKLRIIMQGERLWSVIQRQHKLRFRIKSCFVLAQLHEDYIQLTLNQAVTDTGSEDEVQEAIILQDEIIPIQNIYDSLCSNMWSSITQDTSLLQVCKDHDETDTCLFSRETRTQFIKNFTKFISEKILLRNNDLHLDDRDIMQLGSTCDCVVPLSVRDIIDISFKSVLRDIASVVSSSLVNKKFFGLYDNIEYVFSIIYFNNNRQFQPILADLLGEEIDSFNEAQNVDPYTLVIPILPNQLLKPTIYQQALYYKSFRFGDLQQISNGSYGFIVEVRKEDRWRRDAILYREKEAKILFDPSNELLILLKKGDIINNVSINKTFYCKFPSNYINGDVEIAIYKLNGLEGLASNGTISRNLNHEPVYELNIDLDWERYNMKNFLPLMISVETRSHSSSIQFLARIVGQDNKSKAPRVVVGEPMLLTSV